MSDQKMKYKIMKRFWVNYCGTEHYHRWCCVMDRFRGEDEMDWVFYHEFVFHGLIHINHRTSPIQMHKIYSLFFSTFEMSVHTSTCVCYTNDESTRDGTLRWILLQSSVRPCPDTPGRDYCIWPYLYSWIVMHLYCCNGGQTLMQVALN
jgi:hypothetical protein